MRIVAILIALLTGFALSAQQKGVSPVPSTGSRPPSTVTRAVVVGISDYQDSDIPDLRFANRDAEAFANFLRSPGGGSLSSENLRVLINQDATGGQVIAALTWLLDESKSGDQAIIYFSGHGDVEAKLLNQLGFLLLWDSPAHAYLAGALPVDMLRQVVSTLSIEQKTKVFIVVDACRAGKLAGSTVIGTQLTSNQLAQQFSHEQKILSCQPNEYSIEGEQWGGGRGVFSYHLCNGLYGLADGDHDGQVSLFEIGRYLEDRVPKEVSPLSQLPLTVGDKSGALFPVDGPTLAVLEKQGTPPVSIARVELRGMLQEVLAKADTSVRFWYAGFERTLRSSLFFEPAGDCAEYFFQKLLATESISALHPALKRNYAAALQDDAQQAINIWLKADVQQLECIGKSLKLDPIPRQLERAAELLGEEHYMYRPLQARKLLFEGILLGRQENNSNESRGRQCISLFRQALAIEPNSPLPWHQMGMEYAKKLHNPDSAFACAREARSLAPNWVLPFSDLASRFITQKKFELARLALIEAEAIDSLHPYVSNDWANWYSAQSDPASWEKAVALFEQYLRRGGAIFPCWHSNYAHALQKLGRFSESETEFKKGLARDSTNNTIWHNLGFLYIATRRYAEAEAPIQKAIALDSTKVSHWTALGKLYGYTGRLAEAERAFKKTVQLDSTASLNYLFLGDFYFDTDRPAEAEAAYKKAIALDSTKASTWNNLGLLYVHARRYAEAEEALKKATALDSNLAPAYYHLGTICFKTNRPDEAQPYFLKAIALAPKQPLPMLGMAYSLAAAGKTTEALTYVEEAIGKGSTFEQLEKDEDLAPLRALPEWKALMKKHFPDKVKD